MAHEWRAGWIWWRGHPSPRNFYLKGRKSFTLNEMPDHCMLRVTADSRYVLWVNGDVVCRGPARCRPEHQAFDTVDVVKHLRVGENVLAILVHHYGEGTFQYLHRGQGGFLVDGAAEFHDGREVRLDTDRSWKVTPSRCWDPHTWRLTVQLAFQEQFDARCAMHGWISPGFDDAAWQEATELGPCGTAPWTDMEPRIIPFLKETPLAPVRVASSGSGKVVGADTVAKNVSGWLAEQHYEPEENNGAVRWSPEGFPDSGEILLKPVDEGRFAFAVVDFGREVSGNLSLQLANAGGGEHLCFGYGEFLVDGLPNHHLQTQWSFKYMADSYTAAKGMQKWHTFSPRGFRYLLVVCRNHTAPLKLSLGVLHSTYPVGNGGTFECSDELLTRIWKTGRDTLELCMYDAYVDCPHRERAQWWGDARVEALINFYAFGDSLLLKRGLRQAAHSQREDGLTYGIFPTEYVHPAMVPPDYCLVWVMTLWDYHWWTGDDEPLREHFEAMCKAMDWFDGRVAENGLVGPINDLECYLDWKDINRHNQNSILNMFYLWALRAASQACDRIGQADRAGLFRMRAATLEPTIRELLFSSEAGAFIDGVDDPATGRRSDDITQQANALAILLGLPPLDAAELAGKVLLKNSQIRGKPPVQAQPYFSFYVLEALARAGLHEEALDEIRTRWGEFFEHDAVTFWEHWPETLDEKAGMSLCHAWSSAPTHHLSATVLGVRPTAPGFAEFEVAPRPAGLEWAGGKVPTPHGSITVDWRITDGRMRLEVDVPEGLTGGTAVLPDGRRTDLNAGPNTIE